MPRGFAIKSTTSVGEVLPCRVTELGSWGLYATTKTGDRVFVAFGELRWERVRSVEEIAVLDDVVDVKILATPDGERPHFLGSIKRARSEHHPWSEKGLRVGEIHAGTVLRTGTNFLFVMLDNEVLVGVENEAAKDFRPEQDVRVRLLTIDTDSWVIMGSICEGDETPTIERPNGTRPE